jgi:presequence protease
LHFLFFKQNIKMDIDNFGFRLIEKRFVKEVNGECLSYEHIKTGAKLLKIAADDPNKTFCIAFKTFPDSDNGAPHIMEHALLNGSANFPVKSPFDVLLKGSLHTFLNALTSKDMTMFPVASMNQKDYFNLMHVYLDAVFNPLIYSDPRILKQEGWHYELESPDSPVYYKGVVYNEMKGAFSNPVRELWYQVFKELFPENAYGFESGGHPDTIPSLTNEQFLAFHRKYYHPGNSYIYLYGDGDLEKELEFLDKEYLSKFEKTDEVVSIKEQSPFEKIKKVTGYYPAIDGESTDQKSFLSMNWIAGSGVDRTLTMALDVLCEVLVNQESAPVRLALQEAGIGQDVMAGSYPFQQTVLQIMAQNANPGDKERFYDIVRNTLSEIAEKGVDRMEATGVINRIEFLLREGNDAQKGFTYINQSLPGYLFAGDPFMGLEYEKPLAEVKAALEDGELESIIRKYFLENSHLLLHVLEPKPGLDTEKTEKTESLLKEFKSGLAEYETDILIRETEELIEYQRREDAPEALATVPMLELSDIETKAAWHGAEEMNLNGTTVLFREEFTNDVVFLNLYFDARRLPQEMIPYASLLTSLIGLLDTEHYTYGALNQELNIHTGGFYSSLNTYLENLVDQNMIPKFMVSSKSMNTKTGKLFALTGEILNRTIYRDAERLQTLVARHYSQLEASIKRSGNRYAGLRLSSYFTKNGVYREQTEGLEYFWFIRDLHKNFDSLSEEIRSNLEKAASLLFTRENMVVAVTCSRNDLEDFMTRLPDFIGALKSGTSSLHAWEFNPEKKNEGIETASDVQYVLAGYDFKKLGYAWNGRMRVLSHILSTDWLQTQIRVIGGAYGGYSVVSPDGLFSFNSYRDPNLRETLDNYKATVDYLRNFDADEKSMTRFIIGTISRIDQPMTPSQKGGRAVSNYFTKRSREEVQQEREEILSTTAEDIRGFAVMIGDLLDQNAICVYGGAEKIRQNSELFVGMIRV